MPRPKLPYTFKLTTPIPNADGNDVNELVITVPPKSGDFMGVSFANPTLADFMLVMSKIFRIPMPMIKKLDPADAMEISGVISDFLVID